MRSVIRLKLAFTSLALVVASAAVTAIGYPDNTTDLGQQGDFLWKAGTQFGRTANLTNIGPYLVNLPEAPGSTGVGLPNNTTVYHDSIWDMSDLTDPQMIHEFDSLGMPIHAHATIVMYTDSGPRLEARNSGRLGYDSSGSTAIGQVIIDDYADWPNDVFTYSQMTSPFVARNYWSYGLNRDGVFAIQDPSRFMQEPDGGGYVITSGPIPELFGYDVGVWTGEPYVYWDHFNVADVTGFSSFSGHHMIIASDQLSTGMAIYDVAGLREGRVPRLVSVFQPDLVQPDGSPIGVGGYWVEPYGTTKMVYSARQNDSIGRSYPALYVVDYSDPYEPYLSCEIYFDRNKSLASDGDGSSDPMYVNFQDQYIYVDHFKVDLDACESAIAGGQSIEGDLFDSIVYKFDDIANGCDGSQYFRPLGQVGVFGGYDWWETPTINEQGMCGFVTSDEPDTRAPELSGHVPGRNAVNYPIDGFLHFHIPETLRSETLEGAIDIRNTSTNSSVDYRMVLTHTGTISVFPDSYLAANTTYEVTVQGIQDYMGNEMASYTYSFSTDDGDLLKGEQPFPPLNYDQPAPPATIARATGGSSDPAPEPDGPSPTYSGTTYFPQQSSPIACDPDTENGLVWAVNPDNDTVGIIESTLDSATMVKSHSLVDEISLLYEAPTSVARLDDVVAVTYRDDDKVVFFTHQGAPLFSLDSGHGTQPVAAVGSGHILYVALYGSGEVIRINANTRQIEQRLNVGPTPKAMAKQGNRLLVTRFISPTSHGEVYDIDLSGGVMALADPIVINKVMVGDDIDHGGGVPNYLSGIAISADGTRAYVSATKANTDRGLRPGSTNPQLLDSDNTVRPMMAMLDLVLDRDMNVDPTTRSNSIDLDNGADPSFVSFVVNPSVRATTLQGNDILILTNTELNETAQFDTGGAPQGVCSTRRTLYVKNFTDRTVSAIDIATYLDRGSLQQTSETLTTVNNEVLSEVEKLGLSIFYQASIPEMGPEGYMSCASCHAGGGQDGRVWDMTQSGEGVRNTLSLNGASGTRFGPLHWSANFDEVQDFELQIEGLNAGDGLVPGQTFTGQSPLVMTTAGLSDELDALAAYVSSLGKSTVRRSPHKTPTGGLSAAASRGKAIFTSTEIGDASCDSCHAGNAFRDGLTHDVGTIGFASGQRLNEQLLALRTPTLVELWNSAPYFHDGSAETLQDVLQTGSHAVPLTDSQRDDLVQYLLTIDRDDYIDDVL